MSRLAILLPSLTGGGAERALLELAREFKASGHAVDLLVSRVKGDHDRLLPADFTAIRLRRASTLAARVQAMAAAGADRQALMRPILLPLKSSWALRYLPDLTSYLRERRPTALVSANSWPNLVAVWAKARAGVDTRVVVSEHIHMSQRVRHLERKWRWRHLPDLVRRTYPRADGIVAVSEGVAEDLVACAGLARERVVTIPNPVVTPAALQKAREPIPHPWLAPDSAPVALAAGRFHPQKDFPLLLRAFARATQHRPALRLIVLGEGAERPRLEQLAHELGIEDSVSFPGHAANPYAFMSRAAVFVLSSIYEGLPTVLIEALACGVPVVSTDCPSGPAEILENGRFGRLVPVGDPEKLAAAILETLDAAPDRERLQQRGLDFTAAAASRRYLPILLGDA
jgi:glycosyltransferase involved in cell wall biosynthesis